MVLSKCLTKSCSQTMVEDRAKFSIIFRGQWVTSCVVIQMEVATKKNKFSNGSHRRGSCTNTETLPLNLSTDLWVPPRGSSWQHREHGEDRVFMGENTVETCTANKHWRDRKFLTRGLWVANTQRLLPQRSVDILCHIYGKARASSCPGGSGANLQVWGGENFLVTFF